MSQKPFDIQDMESYLESMTLDYPICEYAFGDTSQIPLSDKVYTICETDCQRYKKCWACPPNAGTIEYNIGRMKHYRRFFVYSTVWEVSDAMNFDACLGVRREHEAMARAFRRELFDHYGLTMQSLDEDPYPVIHFMSAGCAICDKCACPDEPCRHPEERLMSMESHGILIMQLVEELGVTYSYDGTTVVYFSMILY